ncbi:MAG: P27 family phage terminase small subunit [Smithella sp.]|jgi:P27 family predicted phage terminase small subunit
MKKAPKHLKAAAKRLWKKLLSDYHIDDSAGLALLEAACLAYQSSEEARGLVRREGLTITDRFGQTRPHPGVAIEHNARAQMIAAFRALKLAPSEVN